MDSDLIQEERRYKERTKYYQGRKVLQMENNVTEEEQCHTGIKQNRKENGNVLARENRDTT